MTQKRLWWLLLPAATLDCGPGQVTYAIDPACSMSQAGAAQSAAEEWNAVATRKLVLVHDRQDPDYLILPAKSANAAGLQQKRFGLIRIDPNALDWKPIVLHELGHALGVKHVSNPNAVMNPTPKATMPSSLTMSDIVACQEAGACD